MVTTSGMCSAEPLNCTIAALGHDRVMFAADYPFESAQEAGEFMDHTPLAEPVREDIAFNNAAKYLGHQADRHPEVRAKRASKGDGPGRDPSRPLRGHLRMTERNS